MAGKKFNISAVISLKSEDFLKRLESANKATQTMAQKFKKVDKYLNKLTHTFAKLSGKNKLKFVFTEALRSAKKLAKVTAKIGMNMAKMTAKGIGGLAVGALGAGYAFKRTMIDGSANTEATLQKLTVQNGGDATRTKADVSLANKYGKQTGYSNESILDTIYSLKMRGVKDVDMDKYLSGMIKLSAKTGKDISQTMEAFLDAQTGEGERLKELGIKQKITGEEVQFSFFEDGIQKWSDAVDKNDPNAISKALLLVMEKAGKGGIQALKGTWKYASGQFDRMVVGMRDSFMLEGGVMKALSNKFMELTNILDGDGTNSKMKEWGERLSEFIRNFDLRGSIEDAKVYFKSLETSFGSLIPSVNTIGIALKGLADFLGLIVNFSKGVGTGAAMVAEKFRPDSFLSHTEGSLKTKSSLGRNINSKQTIVINQTIQGEVQAETKGADKVTKTRRRGQQKNTGTNSFNLL